MKYLSLFFFLVLAAAAQAQIAITLSVKERFYLLHEPVLATVNVTNLTGHDITLSDTQQYQWFGFRVIGENDRMVPARDLHYHLDPLPVKSGTTVRRTVNLTSLYQIDEPGNYRVQATIYYDGLDKYFISKPTYIDLAEGHVIWQQIAGVPEGLPNAGQMRLFSLIAHEREGVNTLYVRVTDKEEGTIYCTMPIGRLLDGMQPQVEFDSADNLYILTLNGTRAYLLTQITPNGQLGGQSAYSSPKAQPRLRKAPNGSLVIVGGKREIAAADKPNIPVPKLSDRPKDIPTN